MLMMMVMMLLLGMFFEERSEILRKPSMNKASPSLRAPAVVVLHGVGFSVFSGFPNALGSIRGLKIFVFKTRGRSRNRRGKFEFVLFIHLFCFLFFVFLFSSCRKHFLTSFFVIVGAWAMFQLPSSGRDPTILTSFSVEWFNEKLRVLVLVCCCFRGLEFLFEEWAVSLLVASESPKDKNRPLPL